jgi:hypothetical protein
MNRRPGTSRPSWSSNGSRGLYTAPRGNRSRSVAIAAAAVVGVVVLAWVVSRAFGGSCETFYCPSDDSPAIPGGYELASKVFTLNAARAQVPSGNDVRIQLPLTGRAEDARNLSFYRYDAASNTWNPMGASSVDPEGKTASGVFDEAPPTIAVLRRLLPAGQVVAYLPHGAVLNPAAAGRITILHTYDFAPAADGSVTGELTAVPDKDESLAHYPVISAFASDKGSIPIVSSILSSAPARSAHVAEIVRLAAEKQLAGLDIAYLDLAPDQKTSFTLFVAELGQQLHAQGRQLTLTLPPPIRTQERVDTGAYDWPELAKAADLLKMTPYRDQNTYRTAMPAILQSLSAAVPSSKLILTVTPYATEKGAEGLRTLTLAEAMRIATQLQQPQGVDGKITASSNVQVLATNIDRQEKLSGVMWQPETATVAFTYKSGDPRTVWLENVFSVGFKLELIPRHQLGGLAVEDASDNPFLGDIWRALVPFIATGQPTLLQPNPEDLAPVWSKSGGEFEGGERAGLRGSVNWATPAEPGTYTVTLSLSDGVYRFENELSITVQPRDPRAPAGSATPQPTPVG